MSRNIDERVVSMKLNNSQFESNAKKTLGTLKNLSQALKLDKAASGLSTIANAAKNFRLGRVDQEVQGLTKSFSALSVIGVTALATIANKAVNAGLGIAKSLTLSPISDGFREYELKMSSIQTILANTSRHGTTLKEVSANLDELNKYADRTIYNFGDMTRNIGLFTNAGIGIEDATAMIQGFSNVAAASGTSAQGAASGAYQLSQALSAGTIRLMDWKSLTTVGMGNKNMQHDILAIAEAMGTLTDTETSSVAVRKDFNSSLKTGWLTADVMSMYLKVMAEDNEKLNLAQLKSIGITGKQADAFIKAQKVAKDSAVEVRTLTQFFGTLKEGIGSGWADTFTIVLGDFKSATSLFTGLSERVGKIFEKMGQDRNKILSDWSKFGGRAAGIESIKNIFEALSIVVGAVKDAFQEIFPPKTGKELANITKSFRDFTETLKMGPENADRLKRIFKGLFAILSVGITIVKTVANTLLGFFGIAQGGSGGFLELAASIGDFIVKIQDWLATNDRIASFFKTIDTARLAVMVPLVAIFGHVAEALAALFKGDFEGFKQGMLSAFQGIGPLIDGIWKNATSAISKFLGKVRDASAIVGEFLKSMGNTTATKFGNALQFVSEKIGQLRELIRNFGFSAFSKGSKGASTTAGALGKAGEKVADVFRDVKRVVGDFFSGIWAEIGPFARSIMTLFTTISTKIAEFVENMDFTDAVALLNTGMFIMMFRAITKTMEKAGGMYDGFKGIGDKIGGVLDTISGTFTSTFKTVQQSLKADILMKIALAIGVLSASLWVLSRIDPKALGKAIAAVGSLLIMLKFSIGGLLGVMDEFGANGPLAALNVMAAGSALMMLAASVLLLSFAVTKLSKLSWEEMAKGLISVGVLIGALTLFSKFATLEQVTGAGNMALIAMAVSVLALSFAVEKLAKIDTPALIRGTSAVAALIAVMTASAVALQKAASGTLGLIAMAVALNLLIAPITVLAFLPTEKLKQGMTAVGLALLALSIAALLMSNPMIPVGAAGMILIALALNLLIVPLTTFGLLPTEVISQGLKTIAIALGILVVAMLLMANPLALAGSLALVAIAFGLNLLIPPITALGSLPWETVTQGLKALALVLGLLIVAGILLVPAAIGFGLFGAALVLIGVGAFATGVGLMLVATAIGILVGVGVAGITLMSLAITTFASLLPVIAVQIGLAIRAFVTVIAESGPAMIQAFSAIINALLTAIIKNMPKFIQAMDKIIKGLLTLLERNLPQFLRVMNKIISGMLQTIRDRMPDYIRTMTELLNGLLRVIQNVTPQFYQTMRTIIMGMVNMIVSLIPSIAAAGVKMILSFLTVIERAVPQIARKGTDIMIALIRAIGNEVPRLADAGAKAIIKLVNGIAAAIRNNQSQMNAAGRNLASAIINGMTGGLFSGVSKVMSAAKSVADSALSAAKNKLGIKSPSREFRKIGEFSIKGFIQGLTSNSAGIVKAMKDMRTIVNDSISASKKRHADLTKTLNTQLKARNRNNAAIRKTRKALSEANRELLLANRARKKLSTFNDETSRLRTLANQYDSYGKKIDEAKQKLKDAQKVRDDYRSSTAEQFNKLPDISAETKLPEFINSLEKQIVDTQVFNAQLKKLAQLGLNDTLYKDIVSKGVDAMPFATQILNTGKNGVNQLNTLQKALDKSAKSVGYTASQNLYQAGVDSANGLLKGLQSKQKAIDKLMQKIAKSMVTSIKRTLGIKSPSKEFAKVAVWSAEGLVKGFEESAPMTANAADKVGKDTIEAFRKSLSGMSAAISDNINADPTIRPVLDLSAIKRDANQIGTYLGEHDIRATSSYAAAKALSADYRLPSADESASNTAESSPITFNQYNNSPKALSEAEIYRNTKNQISTAKGALKV